MSIEKQLETIMRCLAAETEEERGKARAELREMMCVKSAPAAEAPAGVENIITAVLLDLGVPTAYALDGGQTATIVMNDRLINKVSYGSQREISDILYFATAIPDAGRKGVDE